MSGEDLFLGAPQGTVWPLTLDDVEPQLRARFPDVYVERLTSAVTGRERLSFAIVFPDGIRRHGIYVDRDNLALTEGDANLWADTMAWFLSLLPPGTPALAMRNEGPTIAEVPEQIRTPEGIAAFFRALPE